MKARMDLSDCTLSTENQAVVDAVNEFLAWLPDDADPKPALRLAMMILEAADVASQDDLAKAAGFSQPRSLRGYKQRLRDEGLSGLWDPGAGIECRCHRPGQNPQTSTFSRVKRTNAIEGLLLASRMAN